jgi:MFS family permease
MIDLARLRLVWTATIGATGLAVAYGAVVSFLPPHATQRSLTATGAFFTVFALAMMTAQALSGWLSDRIGRRTVALPGMVLAVAAMLALGAARSNSLLLVSGAGLGLSWGLVRASLDTAVVEAVAPGARATALGFFYTWFDIGVGAGAFGLGILAQAAGYETPFYAAAVWATLALAGYLAWSRPSG